MNRWLLRLACLLGVLAGIYIAGGLVSIQIIDCIDVCRANGCLITQI